MELTGKAVLITGAKRIGGVVARELAACGMDVAVSYNRSRAEAEAAAATVTAAGRRAHVAAADLSKPEDCRALVDGAAAAFGRLDVLVNNAATNPYYGHILDTDLAAYQKTVDVNIRGYFFASIYAGRLMRRRRAGSTPASPRQNSGRSRPRSGFPYRSRSRPDRRPDRSG